MIPYGDAPSWMEIILRGSDGWVVKKYGKRLPKGWKVIYMPNMPDDEKIQIDFNNGRVETFDFLDRYDDIMNYYNKVEEPVIKYKLTVEVTWLDTFKRYELSHDMHIPSTWKCKQAGSSGSSKKSVTNYSVYGPKSDRIEAVQAINDFYSSAPCLGKGMEYTLVKEDVERHKK